MSLPRKIIALIMGFFNNLTVGQKVMTVIGVEILSYSIITSIALVQIHMMGQEIKQMANLYIPLLSTTGSIRETVQEERLHFKDIVVSGDRVVYDKDAEDTYIAARTSYREANDKINNMIFSSEKMVLDAVSANSGGASVVRGFAPSLLHKLSSLRDAQVQTTDRVNEIFTHVEDGSFLMGLEMVDEVTASEGVLLAELDSLEADLHELKAASVDYATNAELTSSRLTITASIVTVCVVILIFFLIVKRSISEPLHVLTDAINRFDPLKPEDEKDERADETRMLLRGDELGMVARSLRELKATLRTQGQALKAAKESAERADRGKTRFLAAASHDLRQPLHAMQMYIAVLRHRMKDRRNISIVEDIQAVSFATGRLLNSLLDVSQLEAGAIKPQYENFAVQDLLERAAISFLPLATRKNLTLRVVPSSLYVNSDPALMERVISNFLSNAIRYTEKGKILVGCRRRGELVAIQVWDTGPGIPDSEATAIFEDFHQLHNDERDRSKGLGLGLAIVKRLAECLGHLIEHRSTVGRGSYFGVLAPCAQSVTALVRREDRIDGNHDLTGIKILLIEDDKVVSDATAQLLQSWKCKVFCVRTTEEALALIDRSKIIPDVVLADYRLPGKLDGVEAIHQIQIETRLPVPGIIITGESDLTTFREIEREGFMILRKPVRPAKLRRLIAHHVLHSAGLPADVA